MSHKHFKVNLLCNCLNAKELFARTSCDILKLSGCNETPTYNHLVCKRLFIYLASLAKRLSVSLQTKWLWIRVPLQSQKKVT